MLAIDAAQDGRTIDLPVGQMVELRLKENRTTGFAWQVSRDGAPGCRIAADFVEAPSGIPGSGGTHVWRIEGIEPGLCELALAYARSWETGRPAATFTLGLNVTR